MISDCKNRARILLKGRVWQFFGRLLLLALIGSVLVIISGSISGAAGEEIGIVTAITTLLSLLSVLTTTFCDIVKAKFFLDSAENYDLTPLNFKFAFNAKRFFNYLGAKILSGIIIGLGLICFVIPGIFLFGRYALLKYIFVRYEDITCMDALARCKQMAKGNEWRIVGLYFSFIGWYLLAAITFGLVMIYVAPYMEASAAIMFDTIDGEVVFDNDKYNESRDEYMRRRNAAHGGSDNSGSVNADTDFYNQSNGNFYNGTVDDGPSNNDDIFSDLGCNGHDDPDDLTK